MIDGVSVEEYPPEFFPWLYPSLYPDYWNSDPFEPVPEPDPVLEPDPAAPPMEVISVDELLDRLNSDEAQAGEPYEEYPASEAAIDPGDTVAAELEPSTLAIIKAINFVKDAVTQVGDEVTEMQLSMDRHPALTTSFAEYTVTEGLLLLLLLSVFIAACARMLRGGLSWLRS